MTFEIIIQVVPVNLEREFFKELPYFMEKIEIQEKAESIAKNMKDRFVTSIKGVLRIFGGTLEYDDLEPGDSKLVKGKSGTFTLYLSKCSDQCWDSFTIMKRIGHLILHPDIDYPEQRNQLEFEARWFSFAYLMPKAEILHLSRKKDMDSLALHFGVTRLAIEERLRDLNDSENN